MDEVLFRSSQRLENLQVQISLAASQSKDILQQYSQQSKSAILQVFNNPYSIQVKNNVNELWYIIVNLGRTLKNQIWVYVDPQKLYYSLVQVFWKKWSRRDICFLGAGFVCGTVAGAIFALSVYKKDSIVRYMQAVQCTNYLGIESATVIENAVAPDECGENDVIVNVKAASVQVVDARICSGYGKTLRTILRRIHKQSKSGLPVTLGRDCTGIITDLGSNVKRLELGDEVWLTVPFWSDGTLSQTVKATEFRIGRKPKNVGFEGACSLPYAGSLALNALKEAEINQDNALHKKVLVVGGCTPVGCVLIQVLKHWKAAITTTCYKRAVPVAKALGALDIIVCPEPVRTEEKASNLKLSHEDFNAFRKEFELRDRFDCVIVTRECGTNLEFLQNFTHGKVVSTLPDVKVSDSCGFVGRLVLRWLIRGSILLERLFGISLGDFDEAHMCYVTLDELADLVENNHLQTVVDKVFHPQDIEIALNHIQSHESIGSTVITFR